MMNCLTNTMVIGNNEVVIIAKPGAEKCFPFCFPEGSSAAPIRNITLLQYTIEQLQHIGVAHITVYGGDFVSLKEICDTKKVDFITYDAHVYEKISNTANDLTILDGSLYLSFEDIKMIVNARQTTVVCRKWENRTNGFGGEVNNGIVSTIYGNPRDHYATHEFLPAVKIVGVVRQELKWTKPGVFSLNCGQMPNDSNYYIESAVAQLANKGFVFCAAELINNAVFVKYAWDIFEMNYIECSCLNKITQDNIDETAKVKNVYREKGHIIIGENSHVENVVFEGNCIIGRNTTIKNGAVIENNCIIGDNTTITNSCIIHSNSVIGNNNKLSFGAEIAGVTMEGVAAVHTCEVYGVIGKYVDIAAGVIMAILRFDDSYVVKRINGLKISNPYTNCVCIGNYTRTGVNTTFFPGVHVGEKCALGPGLLVDKDIEANTLVTVKQEKVYKQWGSNMYGW